MFQYTLGQRKYRCNNSQSDLVKVAELLHEGTPGHFRCVTIDYSHLNFLLQDQFVYVALLLL